MLKGVCTLGCVDDFREETWLVHVFPTGFLPMHTHQLAKNITVSENTNEVTGKIEALTPKRLCENGVHVFKENRPKAVVCRRCVKVRCPLYVTFGKDEYSE